MEIIHNFSLKKFNTFGINAIARQFVNIKSIEDLEQILIENKKTKKLILGGGSNMLLTQDIDALVIHINLKGKKIIRQNDEFVWVQAMAGENWHEFVLWTLDQNFGGLENMSLIPGNVGTTPVQNIGAYGAEIKDTFDECETISIDNQIFKIFKNKECQFGYRESVFKNEAKDQYIITGVTFKLTKKNHKINIAYGDIMSELENQTITNPTIKQVSNAITNIRNKKLPNPKELGNSGSFFKNPIISSEEFDKLKIRFPDIKSYKISENQVKVPAGWLIEQSGFKGKRFGDAGVHKNQALVLVNYGDATGHEILSLATNIQHTIYDRFGIKIETEVNII